MMEMQESEEVGVTPPASMKESVDGGGGGAGGGAGGWGWGGWRTSAFSVLTEFQKAAAEAADEIQKNVR